MPQGFRSSLKSTVIGDMDTLFCSVNGNLLFYKLRLVVRNPDFRSRSPNAWAACLPPHCTATRACEPITGTHLAVSCNVDGLIYVCGFGSGKFEEKGEPGQRSQRFENVQRRASMTMTRTGGKRSEVASTLVVTVETITRRDVICEGTKMTRRNARFMKKKRQTTARWLDLSSISQVEVESTQRRGKSGLLPKLLPAFDEARRGGFYRQGGR